MLLAKLTFTILLLHGPILVVDLLEGLLEGFSFTDSLGAAVSRSINLLFIWSLPTLAIASMTRTLGGAAIGLAIALLVPIAFSALVSPALTGSFWSFPTFYSGLLWIRTALAHFLGEGWTFAIIGVQYWRRRTSVAWTCFAVLLLAQLVSRFLPWDAAFAIQQMVSPNTDAPQAVEFAFAPDQGRYKGKIFGDLPVGQKPYIPLLIEHPPASAVIIDRSEVRIVGSDGETLYLDIRNSGLDPRRKLGRDQVMVTGQQRRLFRPVDMPANLYKKIADRAVRLELTYYLTISHPGLETEIPLFGEHQPVAGLGFCTTKPEEDGNGITIGCRQEGSMATCFTASLKDPAGRLFSGFRRCAPDYGPLGAAGGADAQKRVVIPFRNPTQGTLPPDTQVAFTTYEPMEHFVRTVIIPEIRLKDWEPERSGESP